jgi:putative peptide zinc metalloprotease protein
VQGFLANILFLRLPIFDPDRLLSAVLPILGWVFSWPGLLLWLALVGTGLVALAGRVGELTAGAEGVLAPHNLPLLYAGMVLAKVLHEFGHALACKKFGRQEGAGHEVHVMGVMFLVLMPLPYVDVSSSWTFRSKWRRAVVGAAGMLVETALAAVAAVVWARTPQGSPLHAVAYNILFIAGVSTVLFNGNPLLRYDAYYILSDLLEIPNLAQRSKEYLYYLVKKYAWGVRQARSPAQTPGERAWMVFYGIASFIYRTIVCVYILLFIADQLLVLGMLLAAASLVAWVLVPIGKFVRYLVAGAELSRTRGRAALSTLAVVLAAVAAVGIVSASDCFRSEGPVDTGQRLVYVGEDGFVEANCLPSGTDVSPNGPPLLRLRNPVLEAELAQAQSRRRELRGRLRLAEANDPAGAQIVAAQLEAQEETLTWLRQRVAALEVRSPLTGRWVSPRAGRLAGAYLRKGERLGSVVPAGPPYIRVAVEQAEAARLFAEEIRRVEIRVRGRPGEGGPIAGRIERIVPAGQERLPSAALGHAAGGTILTASDDPNGTKAAERIFEVWIVPEAGASIRLLDGQRVVVRFEMPPRPLALQWWRSLYQVFQERFHVT